jgi:hypothetical protein
MSPGPAFGRRRLLRSAADAVVRRFAHLSGADGSEGLLRSAPPRPVPDSGAHPDNPPQLCAGILCTPVSCTGCACGGNLYHCVGCGRNYVACLSGRGCRRFCLQPIC